MLISIRDARRAKMCAKGCKNFFDRYQLDWRSFTADGIPEEQFASTGDALAFKLIKETKTWAASQASKP